MNVSSVLVMFVGVMIAIVGIGFVLFRMTAWVYRQLWRDTLLGWGISLSFVGVVMVLWAYDWPGGLKWMPVAAFGLASTFLVLDWLLWWPIEDSDPGAGDKLKILAIFSAIMCVGSALAAIFYL